MDKNVIWLIEKIHKINKQIKILNERQEDTADMIIEINRVLKFILDRIK